MIIFLVLLLLLVLFLLVQSFIKDGISKLFVNTYVFWWLSLLFVSNFNLYGLYPVSYNSYGLLLLNVICFVFGFIFKSACSLNKNCLSMNRIGDFSNSCDGKIFETKWNLILFIIGIVYVYSIYIKYLSLSIFDIASARIATYVVGDIFSSGVELIFYRLFSSYLFIISSFIFISFFVFKNKNIYIVLSLIYLLIYLMIGGGRKNIMVLLVYFVFYYFLRKVIVGYRIFNNHINLNFRLLILFSIFAISLLFGVVYLTMLRGGYSNIDIISLVNIGLDMFVESFIVYLNGSFRAFDHAINFDYVQNFGGFQYGKITFGGLYSFCSLLLNNFGINIDSLQDLIGSLQSDHILVGNDLEYNFAYTNAFMFYADFGVFGIIIFSFLYGCFVKYIIELFYLRKNLYVLILMGYLYVSIYLSVFTWVFLNIDAFFIVFLLIYMSRKNTKKIKYI